MDKLNLHKAEDLMLYQAIRNFIRMKCEVTPVPTHDLMADSLYLFVNRSVHKFEKGQKEHSGYLRERDLDMESMMEVIDLHWYLTAKTWPTHIK